ncbi:hypothetical protein BH11PAT1_BH11PAT1_6150 [soil metagenome]
MTPLDSYTAIQESYIGGMDGVYKSASGAK